MARALAIPAPIRILDEPTAGVTPAETKETAQLIQENLSGITTIVIEHDLKFLREIADQARKSVERMIAIGTPSAAAD